MYGSECQGRGPASDSYNIIKPGSDKFYVHALYMAVASFTLVAVAARFRHFVTLLHQNIPMEFDLGLQSVKILGLPKQAARPRATCGDGVGPFVPCLLVVMDPSHLSLTHPLPLPVRAGDHR